MSKRPRRDAVRRGALLTLWVGAVLGGLLLWTLHRDTVFRDLARACSASMLLGYVLYLALGSLRGFTLIPSTTLVIGALALFPPIPLFVLTLVGILISSTSIYWFSESLGLKDVFERRHPGRIAHLQQLLRRHELPIIMGWSFFPLAPTDLIVYVCGVMEVDFLKCLAGVGLGEGSICALSIFGGHYLLQVFRFK